MKKINLGQKELIHFVGIGGIGMSGLAHIMKNMGFKIQGSDQSKNKNTINCSKTGIKIYIGHSNNNVKKATILVRSTAIKNNNIEIKYAKKNKIPIYSRAEVLADVVSLKKNIIITGGGYRNIHLMKRLNDRLKIRIVNEKQIGINFDYIESELIAYLSARSIYNLPITYPSTTGASKPSSGGELYKYL